MPGPMTPKFVGRPLPSGVGGCEMSNSIVEDVLASRLLEKAEATLSEVSSDDPATRHSHSGNIHLGSLVE